ncbi:DUF2283 domain-containing protein [Candidatus Pacearchaeota archaeon CG10_big_fil_rev_8_21_14_0_10_31_24]|nr:MAG: DUF2283 domain-containing protein [Candidatus Pacearchaeota archaeon CG10_big_fil_rev_8_21_14_0_10_31_24]
MRTEFDKEADAAYFYFKEIADGEVVETITLNDSVNVDLDKNGKILGIEILDASEHLPSSAFKSLVAN